MYRTWPSLVQECGFFCSLVELPTKDTGPLPVVIPVKDEHPGPPLSQTEEFVSYCKYYGYFGKELTDQIVIVLVILRLEQPKEQRVALFCVRDRNPASPAGR